MADYLINFIEELVILPSNGDRYVQEGTVQHLTWDVICWIMSVAPAWKMARIRYEWERLITGAHGKDMFLELTYKGQGEFPCREFAEYVLLNWYIYFVDFVELQEKTKVIIRMVKKEDMKDDTRE